MTMQRPTEGEVRDALAVIRRDYYAHIEGLADDVLELLEGFPTNDEYDVIHDVVDSSEWVIYTGKNLLALYCCDGDGHNAYTSEFGTVPTDDDGDINWAALAFGAIRQDVQEELRRRERRADNDA